MIADWPFAGLTPLKYGAVLADPPWRYVMRSEKGYAKSPEAHYRTMPFEQLAAMPVGQLAGPNCYLFMWSTWPHLPQALDLLRSWGFVYVTGGSWTKRTRNWKVTMGTGYVQRSSTEPYLVGRIGRPQIATKSERNLIIAPEEIPDGIEAIRREYSRKPVQMREMIGRLLPRSYFCELFAREAWQGHDVWGDQIEKFTVAP